MSRLLNSFKRTGKLIKKKTRGFSEDRVAKPLIKGFAITFYSGFRGVSKPRMNDKRGDKILYDLCCKEIDLLRREEFEEANLVSFSISSRVVELTKSNVLALKDVAGVKGLKSLQSRIRGIYKRVDSAESEEDFKDILKDLEEEKKEQ
jgi:hypothetical protein